MSEQLKIGDRVRIVGVEQQRPTDAQHARILRGEEVGTIQGLIISRASVRFGDRSFSVPTGNIERVPHRRPFEEIINELIENLNKLTEENDYGLHKINTAGTAVIWHEPIPGEITYYDITDEGEFGTIKDYTFIPAAHLAAIAAACQEIAANYAAEHGKEEQQ